MSRPAERSLASAAGAVSAATMISRVLGLARDSVQAALFGAGFETDAFNMAFRIPNLLRDLFAEGALSAAFVPTFTATLKREGESGAWRLANSVLGVLLVVLGAATLVILCGARWIVAALAPGFSRTPGKLQLCAALARILSPFLLFVALAAVMMGVLNVFGRFFLPALAPAVFNLVNIVVTLAVYPLARGAGVPPVYALAIGALAGVIGQFVVQLPEAWRLGFRLRPAPRGSDPGVRKMGSLMLPATIGLAATQINILVDSQFASQWEGAVSWLQYAFRLMYLPIGLVGVAIGTANLAGVSRDAAEGDMEALRRRVAGALRLTLALALPATAGLIALREPIIRTLFERYRFDAGDTRATAGALLAYAIGLAGYSCLKVVVPTFYALGDTATPVRVSFLSVGIKVAASFLLIRALEYRGLALATSIAATLNFGILLLLLSRRVGGLSGLGVGVSLIRSTGIATAMGLSCALAWKLTGASASDSWARSTAWLAAVIALGIAITFILAWLLKAEELYPILRRLPGPFARGRAKP